MKFYSKKGKLIVIVMLLLLGMIIWLAVQHAWPAIAIFVFAESFFLWMWFDTYYIIRDGQLFYKSAIIKGSLPISGIREVEKLKGVYAGAIKPALAMKGLVIKYNRYDDIYLSPERADDFIAELQKINPEIKVT